MSQELDRLLIRIEGDSANLRTALGQSVSAVESASARMVRGMGSVNDASARMVVGMSQIGTAAQAQVAGAGQMASAFALTRGSLMSLQASGINAFQALASGMSLTRVAMTEGAQVAGALAGGLTGNLALAISGVLAVVGLLVSQLGLFSTKSQAAASDAEAFGKAQDFVAGKVDSATLRIEEQHRSLDRWMAEMEAVSNTNLAVEGQKLADMQAKLSDATVRMHAVTHGKDFGPSPEMKQLQQDIDNQQAVVDQLAHAAIIYAKNFSDAAMASEAMEESTAATAANVRSAASSASELKSDLQAYKDRFNEVMRGRVEFSQRMTAVANDQSANVAPAVDKVTQAVDAQAQSWDAVAGSMQGVGQQLAGLIDKTSSLGDVLKSILSQLLNVGVDGKGGLTGLLPSLISGVIGLFGGSAFPGIPSGFKMAGGGSGTVRRPTVFLAGENGEEDFNFTPASKRGMGGSGGIAVHNYYNFAGAMVDEAKIRGQILMATPRIVKQSTDSVIALLARGGRMRDAVG